MANEDKNRYLREDVQQRVILAALRWGDADSAVDDNEVAKPLLGRTSHAPGVSSNVDSYEYSRLSRPDSVVDAPPLIEMLPAEASFFLWSLVRDAVAVGGSHCNSGSYSRTWMPQ